MNTGVITIDTLETSPPKASGLEARPNHWRFVAEHFTNSLLVWLLPLSLARARLKVFSHCLRLVQGKHKDGISQAYLKPGAP